MVSCEKCWRDSSGNAERYEELIRERVCSFEEMAGHGDYCGYCHRWTIHQHTHRCVACNRTKEDDPPPT